MDYSEYRAEVEAIAENVVQQVETYGDDVAQTIREMVDSSRYVFTYSRAYHVVRLSDNEPETAMWREADTFRNAVCLAAFDVVRLDVWGYLRRNHEDVIR